MFDIGWTEITFILIFAIIVIGPKELPRVLRTIGQWVSKAKSITSEFRGHVDEMIRDTELDEVKKQIENAGSFDPNATLENTIDADGGIKNAFDFSGDEFSDSIDQGIGSFDKEINNNTILDRGRSGSEESKLSKSSNKAVTPGQLDDNAKEIKD